MDNINTNSLSSVAHEKELNLLFGDSTDAKNELSKLKQVVDEEISEQSRITENTATNIEVTQADTDTVSSHNSSRVLNDSYIANTTSVIKDGEDTVSSHNFVEI